MMNFVKKYFTENEDAILLACASMASMTSGANAPEFLLDSFRKLND
ncbi:MAG: hypothetical protein Q4B22_02010 [Eubacteriales bacterium]|nr:hypothetical protein [Eubacteriales bacterium]